MHRTHRLAIATGVAILLLVAVAAVAAEGVVNINTASESQLMLLPRVGPSLAKKIVEYRQANGDFKAPEELVLVPGIGDKSYESMAPYVAVKGETTLKDKAKGTATVAKPASSGKADKADKTEKAGT
jgi:competence ComEA-like helix-hairpin-helix protein